MQWADGETVVSPQRLVVLNAVAHEHHFAVARALLEAGASVKPTLVAVLRECTQAVHDAQRLAL